MFGCGPWPFGDLMNVSRCAVVLTLCLTSTAFAKQAAAPASSQERPHPELSQRPAPGPEASQGKMKIDVVVTDQAGQPVAGLARQDFTVFDNNKVRPILSFRAVDGTTGDGTSTGDGRSDPQVEIILVVDVTNTSLDVVSHERDQIEQFLRRNGGRVRVDRPGLKLRTSAGHYGEPAFQFSLPVLSGH
jgi:hypothetical protein